MANVIVYGLVKVLRDPANVLWIGGLIQLSFVILPTFGSSLKKGKFLGFFSFGKTYPALLSVKHILMIAMTRIAASRKVLTKGNQHSNAKTLKIKEMVFINALLSIAVIILSGFCAVVRT